jgi:hypothetical protein
MALSEGVPDFLVSPGLKVGEAFVILNGFEGINSLGGKSNLKEPRFNLLF